MNFLYNVKEYSRSKMAGQSSWNYKLKFNALVLKKYL